MSALCCFEALVRRLCTLYGTWPSFLQEVLSEVVPREELFGAGGVEGKMTLRILFRRVKVLPLRILPSSVHFSCVSAVFSRSPSLLHPYLTGRLQPFSISSTRWVTFSIQDGEDFTERVLNSQLPVLVDFHAQWCGPCKILGPRLEKMVAKQNGKVTMAKVDIDDHTDLAIEYGVSAVPTVLAVKNGNVIDKFVGIKDEDQLDAFIRKLIGP